MIWRTLLAFLFILLHSFINRASIHALDIRLDYRYDGGYFSEHPERRIPLEWASRLWGRVLMDMPTIRRDATITARMAYTRPGTERITLGTEECWLIFVYAHDFSKELTKEGLADPSGSKARGGNWGPRHVESTAAGQYPWSATHRTSGVIGGTTPSCGLLPSTGT